MHLDLKKYINKIKKTYAEIKNLFEDVKAITNDHETLKNIDIDDIKKDIFDLDEKMKSFKNYIGKEINLLKVAEQEIVKQIQEKPDNQKYIKMQTKVHPKPHYNEVVPSPVRAIINSPFKCVEVQRFQEFMKNSCNRYGGWDEYNHNIFVNIWNKHYNCDEVFETPPFSEVSYTRFQDEVLQKIFGVKVEDVMAHTQWYVEYTKLKRCQEVALNKWRENKRKIKNPKQICKESISDTNTKARTRLCKKGTYAAVAKGNKSNEQEFGLDELLQELDLSENCAETFILDNTSGNKGDNFKREREAFSTFYKPTKQWKNRCQGNSDFIGNLNIDDMKKLKTPLWRIDLK
ncbi:coiled-coil domain-containing protein 112-like [Colias croceus]|uniref:coiled-coil domain-containing protein 112-like n=1 Tax=Colias crocea TaxID=72248 RepID=UPI001E27BF0E|nr:coiled-coil domain-containing protein 112-like [Colias croceus]